MKIYYDFSNLTNELDGQKIALTIGNFDGVHCGHRFLIKNFIEYSLKRDLVPVVLTFYPHPYTHITGKSDHKIRIDQDNYDILSEIGIQHIALLKFTKGLKEKDGKTFINELLNTLPIEALYLGHDFSLGANKEFGQKQLEKEFSSKIDIFFEEPFVKNNIQVSSSFIRKLLANGKIKQVNNLLEKSYKISGKIIKGNQVGTRLGFPTANIQYDHSLHLPKEGVYFARASLSGKTYRAAVNIGTRPSVTEDVDLTIEAHILDFSGVVYGEKLELEFIEFIREEQKFSTKDDLVAKIKSDIELIKKKDFEVTFALIGKDIQHSLSPQVYSTLLEGFPISYSLLSYDSEKNIVSLKDLVKKYKRISVTAPYKKYCFENSTVIDDNLNKLEAINAIRLNEESVESMNTDYLACNDLINKYKLKEFNHIYLIGDGAMARILKSLLKDKNISFVHYSRKLKNLESIVDQINQISDKTSLMVINSCSRNYTFPKSELSGFTFWDLNYSMSKHLKLFHTNQVNYIDGFELLMLQAKYALSFWNCKSS